RIEPRARAGWRARDDDVAGHQRGEGRDIVEEVTEAKDQPACAIILPRLAIDAGGQADVRYLRVIGVGHEPWPKAAGGIEILALRDVEFRMAHPVAQRALVAQRDGRDVVERLVFRDVPAGLADDDDQLALIVELLRGARTHQRRVVADKGAR